MVTAGTGRLPLLYIPNTLLLLLLRCFFGNIVGQDQEFQTTDAGKWHFEEQYMQHNYALILWMMCQDEKEWTVLAGKWRLGMTDRGFPLLGTFLIFCFSVCNGSCVQHYPRRWRQLRSYKSQLYTCTWFSMTWEQNCNFSN